MNFSMALSILFLMPLVADANLNKCTKKLQNKRMELNVIASNIVNLNTTRIPQGGPYKRKSLVCNEDLCDLKEHENFILKYEPLHPDADVSGHVQYPDINLENEKLAMIEATRDYEEIVANCK